LYNYIINRKLNIGRLLLTEVSKSWRHDNEDKRGCDRPGSAVEKKHDFRLGNLGAIYQGMGPKDKKTGIPTALRNVTDLNCFVV